MGAGKTGADVSEPLWPVAPLERLATGTHPANPGWKGVLWSSGKTRPQTASLWSLVPH